MLNVLQGRDGWPTRPTVERVWRAVAAGAKSREDAHDWTVPWVEGEAGHERPGDLMVETGLQHVHGLDMAYCPETPHLIHHGPPGIYVRTLEVVRVDLESWLDACREHDDDPVEFILCRQELARLSIRAERAKQRQHSEEGGVDGLHPESH